MQFAPTKIQDVILIEPKVYGDERGFFMETFQAEHFAEIGITANCSLREIKAIRIKLQQRKTKNTSTVNCMKYYTIYSNNPAMINICKAD